MLAAWNSINAHSEVSGRDADVQDSDPAEQDRSFSFRNPASGLKPSRQYRRFSAAAIIVSTVLAASYALGNTIGDMAAVLAVAAASSALFLRAPRAKATGDIMLAIGLAGLLIALSWGVEIAPISETLRMFLVQTFGTVSYLCVGVAFSLFLWRRRHELNVDAALDALIGGTAMVMTYMSLLLNIVAPTSPSGTLTGMDYVFAVLVVAPTTFSIAAISGRKRSAGPALSIALLCIGLPILDLLFVLESEDIWHPVPARLVGAIFVLNAAKVLLDPRFDTLVEPFSPADPSRVPPTRILTLTAAMFAYPTVTIMDMVQGRPPRLLPLLIEVFGIVPVATLRIRSSFRAQAQANEHAYALKELGAKLLECDHLFAIASTIQHQFSTPRHPAIVTVRTDPDGNFSGSQWTENNPDPAEFVGSRFFIVSGPDLADRRIRRVLLDALREADLSAAIILHRQKEQRLASERRFATLASLSVDILGEVSEDGLIGFVSPAVTRVLGYQRESVVGTSVLDAVVPADRAACVQLLEDIVSFGEAIGEFRFVGTEGLTWLELSGRYTNEPDIGPIVVNARCIDDRKAIEAMLRYRAAHDDLTGLGNRRMLLDRLDDALRDPATRAGTTVYFIDLDNFKDVNDTLGHATGDKMLNVVAKRLSAILDTGDVAVRMGGDEFAVVAGKPLSTEQIHELGDTISQALNGHFTIDGHQVPSTASVGVAVAAGDCADAHELLRQADTAMYQAKADTRQHVVVYEPHHGIAAADRLLVREGLQRAISDGELVTWFQPIVELDMERIVGAEALVRWNNPERGLLGPGQFVPLVESSGLGNELGRWVLADTCRHIGQWRRTCPELIAEDFTVSVNVSPYQLEDDGFVESVLSAIRAEAIPPSMITIEITERALISDGEKANKRFHELRAHGVNVAIDDFGTGHSSLGTIHRIQFDIMKIDRSFVADLTRESSDSGPVVTAILDLAAQLRVRKVIAEGIETREEALLLRRMGCKFAQGFLFARPAEGDRLLDLLREQLESRELPPKVSV